MTISERIFERIKEKGMSQKEFSARTGISQSTISEWKKKKTNPTSEKIMPICTALDISPEELLTGIKADDNKSYVGRDYYLVEKKSELGVIVREYGNMTEEQKYRLSGYVDALMNNSRK